MKIKAKYRKKIEFYLINHDLILKSKIGDQVKVRLPFRSKKFYRKKKYQEINITEEDVLWAECSKLVLDRIAYKSQIRTFYLAFVNGEEITEVCDKIGIAKSTYFEWIKLLMWLILVALAIKGIFKREDITLIFDFN